MTPLPKRRHSTQRQGRRRATYRVKSKSFGKCPNCGSATINHNVCLSCGYYKNIQVLKINSKSKVENK